MTTFASLFTPRQLVALTTFSDLVGKAREEVWADARAAGLPDDAVPLHASGTGASAYADVIATYLALLVGKLADKGSSVCTWDAGPTSSRTASGRSARVATVRVTFSRQALPMTWDFAEANLFSESVGSLEAVLRTLTGPWNMRAVGRYPVTHL
jgi:putative DNA methylase